MQITAYLQRGGGWYRIEIHCGKDSVQSFLRHVTDLLIGHIALEGVWLPSKVGEGSAHELQHIPGGHASGSRDYT